MERIEKMRSLVIEAPGKVVFREADLPVPREGEALLKLLYGGICGSDLGSYRGSFAYFDYPRIPGHEFSAQILEVGENRFGLKKGMIVTCNPYFNCGSCYSCQRGKVNCCENNQTMGCQRDGAFSEYITMPVERIYDGMGLPPKTLALIEPFCISYHGVQQADVQPGERVLVMGAGTIGVLAAVAAKSKGAKVWISDVAAGKMRFAAERYGLEGTILNDTPEHFAEQVQRITGGCGFDVTLEAVGLPVTFQRCIDAAAYCGRVVLIGIGKTNLDFNFTVIQKKELCIRGSRNALKGDFEELIRLVKDGGIDLDGIVTDVYLFSQAPKAFEEFSRNAGEKLKVLLKFD